MFHIFPLLFALIFNTLGLALEADFPSLFAVPAAANSEQEYIPKVVHFVLSTVKEASWDVFVAVRAAHDRIEAEKINIWIPTDAQLQGEMWDRILKIPGTVVRKMDMPDSVYGHKIKKPAHVADVARLKVLYEEGGRLLLSFRFFQMTSNHD